MGSSESKPAVPAPKKPEAPIKNSRIIDLDPRSPSTGITRTPIQVCGPLSKVFAEVKSEAFTDPRSPSVGISRTPAREVMRVTVGSITRRLGMLFHNETEGVAPEAPQKCFGDSVEEEEEVESEELASTEPLLTSKPSLVFSSLAEHAHLLFTPDMSNLEGVDVSSPFVHLDEPQMQLEVETEADLSLEEAEEARESPLHKRLSMSLITCHEGATSTQIFAEVHRDGASMQSEEVEPLSGGVDHSYSLPSITVKPECHVEPSFPVDSEDPPAQESSVQSEKQAEDKPSSEETKTVKEETATVAEQPHLCNGIRCPTFDSKSPSQAVFKPQWLGKGFGASGLRARGAQGGKSGSSPLAVRVAVKNVTNENKRQSGKLKQNGSEGRSPLQILKTTNSPRDQYPQAKLKVSVPDKQRHGQMDRRVPAVCLDKENR
ncbi:cell division cycle-associated protein 3 [Xyrichtys novacula]|uniref:Cell division cycle-associated protein 3 n=1 Tax=Xyrichtys novacula TaxID=13765 RepID=A0AAV1FM78_XYRNO|nr:cell division cycle-associated protein 3 [Xyrichtys novacula]